MPFNGSGAFTRLYNWVADRNANIKIRADRMDAEMDGFATGLSNAITRDGQSTVTQNIPFNNKKLTGLADATAAADAMNRQSSDARYTPRISVKTANYTLLAADIGTLILGTGTWTLALLAAATAANGYSFRIKNSGTGVVTIDPDASETIDGASAILVPPGQELTVISDGSNWITLPSAKWAPVHDQVVTTATAAIDISLARYSEFRIDGTIIANPAVADFVTNWRVSFDNGATFDAGAAHYTNGSFTQTGVTLAGAATATASSAFLCSQIDTGAPAVPGRFDAKFFKGATGVVPSMKSVATSNNGSDFVLQIFHGSRGSANPATNLRILTSTGTAGIGIGSRIIVEGC